MKPSKYRKRKFYIGNEENYNEENIKTGNHKPQYVVTTDITYAQVDSWFGHCRRDLKLDLIYPEDGEGKTYPCIVWICGGAWQRMDKAAHLAYLGTLAQEGFVVASVEYRTSNEGTHPMQLCDIKAAIRYLRAYAKDIGLTVKNLV